MKTSANGPTVLVAAEEPETCGELEAALRCCGYAVEVAQEGDQALVALQASRCDVAAVVLDLMALGRNALQTLRDIRALDARLPVIVISPGPSAATVVAAMKEGATDFLGKPVAPPDLHEALDRALASKSSPEHPAPSRSATLTNAFMGSHPEMRELQRLVPEVGWSEAPVLIQGETGSGKEILARELHAYSPRANRPFLKLNCAALPSELVESELFGHERGSFTGAFQRKAGLFEMADGGTILLDEIGDMEVRLQAKLLHVLQEGEFHRIGGKGTIKVDVRVISASHRDLETLIRQDAFREDLFYRLNVISLCVPPLRERKQDIVPLAEFLIRKHSPKDAEPLAIPQDLKRAFLSYPWPGNVRELENTVRRLLILRNPDVIAHELKARTGRETPEPASVAVAAPVAARPLVALPPMEKVSEAHKQAEIDAIMTALQNTRWNRKQAAALLGIDYKALLYKMRKLGVDQKPEPVRGALELWSPRAAAAHPN